MILLQRYHGMASELSLLPEASLSPDEVAVTGFGRPDSLFICKEVFRELENLLHAGYGHCGKLWLCR
jgi:hypothetical protein